MGSRSKDLAGMRFSCLILVPFLDLLIFPPTNVRAGNSTNEATRLQVTAEPIILTTSGQDVVTVTTQGCLQTQQCRSSMGVCVGEFEPNPEGTIEILSKCSPGCKCLAPDGQEPVTLTTPGQEPVTMILDGCLQTQPCSSASGVCVGEHEIIADWMTENSEAECSTGCKCVTHGQEPVTIGQEPVTIGQEPVTMVPDKCLQTEQCSLENGICIGEHENTPEYMLELAGHCSTECKCITPGQEPVTLTTPGQEPVQLTTKGCVQTDRCSAENGVCIGQDEKIPDWMVENVGKCGAGCMCVTPGQKPVAFTEAVKTVTEGLPQEDPVTMETTTSTTTTKTTTMSTISSTSSLIPHITGQDPLTLATSGQEPVTIKIEGCTQTGQCSFENGVCVGENEDVPEWMTEIIGQCGVGCKCIAPGQEPVTLTVPGQEPVTLTTTTPTPTSTTTPTTTTTTTAAPTTTTTMHDHQHDVTAPPASPATPAPPAPIAPQETPATPAPSAPQETPAPPAPQETPTTPAPPAPTAPQETPATPAPPAPPAPQETPGPPAPQETPGLPAPPAPQETPATPAPP